jgi:hypothetical protein
MIRRFARRCLRVAAFLMALLILLEVVYRNQWIDTYQNALVALNPAPVAGDGPGVHKQRRILVLGDSFSASPHGWVAEFRTRMPGFEVINNAVSGTGVVQANIIAHKRIPQLKPDILIYQIYVGNDLADYRYPIHWTRINPLRNIYWWWAHRFRSLAYLNQAFGQLSGPTPAELDVVYRSAFSVAEYNAREKTLLQAEPGLIENQAFLQQGRADDMVGYLRKIDEIIRLCEANGTLPILLVLPHCAQVDPLQKTNMEALGAEFSSSWRMGVDYPFLNRLAGHTQGRATVLNALPALQAALAAGDSLYFSNDPHLTPAGQKFLGQWVHAAMTADPEGIPPAAM